MCRFARSVMAKFRKVCRILELTLGPDTGGKWDKRTPYVEARPAAHHSAPRNRSRTAHWNAQWTCHGWNLTWRSRSFPVVWRYCEHGCVDRTVLCCNTVSTSSNVYVLLLRTASRIESSGVRDRVHLSEQTALQLIKHGKEDWIVRREDMIEAKGKGKLVTFWLKLSTGSNDRGGGSVVTSSELGDDERVRLLNQGPDLETNRWSVEMPDSKPSEVDQRDQRLVQWNCKILLELLHQVVARRASLPSSSSSLSQAELTDMARSIGNGAIVVEEVVEIIDMPDFVNASDTAEVELSENVVIQLRHFVSKIASMYNANPCEFVSFVELYVAMCLQINLTNRCFASFVHAVHNFDHVRNQGLSMYSLDLHV
jgi:Adenylate and Guanylate cyclase catalytic domain